VGDVIETERLTLRRWTSDDLAPLVAMNADPEVMRYFPETLTFDQSRAMLERFEAHFDRYGFGLWVVAVEGRFAGFTGLNTPTMVAPMGDYVEVGWRFASWAWGHGYASEAATASLREGFETHGLSEIFSITTRTNAPSESVMRRIGMRRREDLDFDHPGTPGWWGQAHIVYQITLDSWRAARP
jgi:ribosomal-protein-alanine N-acetyltransferase